jgi:hypothetical protein
MATNGFRLILDTHRRNFSFTEWPITVLDPLETYNDVVEQAIKARAAIDTDPHLTPQGKAAAKAAKSAAAVKAIADVSTPRLAGLDANVASLRTALMPTSTEKPEARRIDFLLSHLRDRTPQEIAVFYNSATDDERLVLEEAARSVGRIPTRGADGSLVWAPLLPAETINESIILRASVKNPVGAKKLQELEEIRAMHASVASIAAATVRETLEG